MILVTATNWDYVFEMAEEWRAIHVYREAKRKVANFVFFMVCEQMLQLQIQISGLSLDKAATGGKHIDAQVIVGLFFGMVVTLIRLGTGGGANSRTQKAMFTAKVAHEDKVQEWLEK